MAKKRPPDKSPVREWKDALAAIGSGRPSGSPSRQSTDGSGRRLAPIYGDDILMTEEKIEGEGVEVWAVPPKEYDRLAEIGLRVSVLGGEGGRHPKKRIGIELAIRGRLAKAPGLSARALWDQFMRYSEVAPLHAGEYVIYGINADMEVNNQELAQDGGSNDKVQYLKFRAFKDYVSRVKKGNM